MINYDELWTIHRCLEIKSNKKNQLFKIRVTTVNLGDNMCDEYLLEQFHLKKTAFKNFF